MLICIEKMKLTNPLNDILPLTITSASGGFAFVKGFFESFTLEQWIAIAIQVLTFIIYMIKTIKEMKKDGNQKES